MNNGIKNIIIIINYTFLTIAMISSALINVENSTGIIFLYLIILSSYTCRTYFVYNNYENEKGIRFRKKQPLMTLALATYILEVVIVIGLQSYDTKFLSFVVLVLLIEDIVVNTNFKLSVLGSVCIYLVSCAILYFKFIDNFSKVIVGVLLLLPVYLTIFIMFYLINYLLRQNEIIEASLTNITIQNIEKDNLYENLKEAYSKIEGITRLRERNKIAAEIHDTVGHTLTTVLVEIEAAKRLMTKDAEASKEKLELAQGQVRKGLNDIRGSVRVLEKGEELLSFNESMEALIEDTEKHSEVVIQRSIDNRIRVPKDLEEVMFSALMEGLSNGIRHGKSTAFLFKLSMDEELKKIIFLLQDNGRGASIISPGFGLRAMRARVREFDGELEIKSDQGDGFSLEIVFSVIGNVTI
jgi:signal transduction histidine kinase